jgi:hypothetical protein
MNYEKSSSLYVVLIEFFLFLKPVMYSLENENHFLALSFEHTKTSIRFVVSSNNLNLNFELLYSDKSQMQYKQLKENVDIIGFELEGHKMIIEKIFV